MSLYPLKTIAEIGLERLDKCSQIVGQIFYRAVRPCFALDDLNQPVAFGSCFFIQLDGARYLVTAAHVLDQAERTPVYISGRTSLVALTGLFSVTNKPGGNRNNDHYDFAFVELSEHQCNEIEVEFFITEDMISKNRVAKESRGYMALGFPHSLQLVSHETLRAFTEAWTFVGFHHQSPELNEGIGITGNEHFTIRFQNRVKKFNGPERDAVEPQGASGGILIDLGNFDPSKLHPDAPCKGLLAGILIEHHRAHETIMATDIQFVISHIRLSKRESQKQIS
ncbi:trypsin-like peptidase domain-containing protein [Lysobacter silvisoli]|uniref:trypsin-like peptidase domain-containing protein n=1 Tax=Lysobacter silvisoli TaxID=2293254 RepID=UPI0011C06918|nr:trypsin-like peptidase domain-containing protein [Lysobacter silvisoli]